ncbi:hypothetical protein SynWH8101_1752 [Synechococcus sp. WH 8101]|nr:hypothetical protein SynWH8101_1752 [Synechococcus sp. WH 8101]QNI45575.1 hypothetical protein SynRCC2555_01794 [Synechococcus sp. WH 8101]
MQVNGVIRRRDLFFLVLVEKVKVDIAPELIATSPLSF